MTAKIVSFSAAKTRAQTPVQLSNVLVEPASNQLRCGGKERMMANRETLQACAEELRVKAYDLVGKRGKLLAEMKKLDKEMLRTNKLLHEAVAAFANSEK